MKNIKKSVSVIFLFIFIIGMTAFSFAQNQKNVNSEFKLKVYFSDVKAKALIEQALLKTEGVKTAKVDLKTKIVTTTFDSYTCDRLKINSAIEKLGFQTEITINEIKAKKACSDSAKANALRTK